MVPDYLTRSLMHLSKLDARMMRSLTGMQQLEVKLELVSAHDYQSILVPLVKSFVRVYTELVAFYIFAKVLTNSRCFTYLLIDFMIKPFMNLTFCL